MYRKKALISIIIYGAIITFLIILFYSKAFIQTSVTPVSKKIIIIDPGHGLPDGGATAKDGTLESELNLAVANELKKLFIKNQATVVMTRSSQNSLSKSKTNNKKEDMKKRKEILNTIKGDAFISIHMNYFQDSKHFGAQVFYNSQSSSNVSMAECIQKELIKISSPANTRDIKNDNNIFILKNTPLPSVLVECGFLSNDIEAKKLKSKKYQKQVAKAIFEGTIDFFEHNNVKGKHKQKEKQIKNWSYCFKIQPQYILFYIFNKIITKF